MGAEFGISIEKVEGIDYPKALQECLCFDDYIGVDTYTPIFWCRNEDLHYEIIYSIDSRFDKENSMVMLTLEDIKRIINVFQLEIDKIKKMKHLLYDFDDAEELAEKWQWYEEVVAKLYKIKWLMNTKGFKKKKCRVFYYASY